MGAEPVAFVVVHEVFNPFGSVIGAPAFFHFLPVVDGRVGEPEEVPVLVEDALNVADEFVMGSRVVGEVHECLPRLNNCERSE